MLAAIGMVPTEATSSNGNVQPVRAGAPEYRLKGFCLPKGPRGEKRPADVIGAAVKVMRITTGEETEDLDEKKERSAAAELGSKGGKARAEKMTAERRAEIARKTAMGRWGKK